jgi:hypothetical protein
MVRGLSVAGFGLTLLIAVLEIGGVKLPAWLLWVVGVVGVGLMLAGLVIGVFQRKRRATATAEVEQQGPRASERHATETYGRGKTVIRRSQFGGRSTLTADDGTTEIEDSDLGYR